MSFILVDAFFFLKKCVLINQTLQLNFPRLQSSADCVPEGCKIILFS
jgi:hypothetical protein